MAAMAEFSVSELRVILRRRSFCYSCFSAASRFEAGGISDGPVVNYRDARCHWHLRISAVCLGICIFVFEIGLDLRCGE